MANEKEKKDKEQSEAKVEEAAPAPIEKLVRFDESAYNLIFEAFQSRLNQYLGLNDRTVISTIGKITDSASALLRRELEAKGVEFVKEQ